MASRNGKSGIKRRVPQRLARMAYRCCDAGPTWHQRSRGIKRRHLKRRINIIGSINGAAWRQQISIAAHDAYHVYHEDVACAVAYRRNIIMTRTQRKAYHGDVVTALTYGVNKARSGSTA